MNCNISRILSPRFRGGDHLSKRPEPGTIAPRAAASSPIWPCSGRGLPCGPDHSEARWSLTPPFHPCRPSENGRRSVLCCAFLPAGLPRGILLEEGLPALWSPDFPLCKAKRPPLQFTFLLYHAPAKMQIVFAFFQRGRRGCRARGAAEAGKMLLFRTFFIPEVAILSPA